MTNFKWGRRFPFFLLRTVRNLDIISNVKKRSKGLSIKVITTDFNLFSMNWNEKPNRKRIDPSGYVFYDC